MIKVSLRSAMLVFFFVTIQSVTATELRCLDVNVFGKKQKICDPSVVELLESKVMQRLKGVDQHGIPHYFCNLSPFSRFDHSVGVYLLVKNAGASDKEQIAALLHDASHTAFSHTADFLFKNKGNFHQEHSCQDTIHLEFLKKMLPEGFIKKHNLTLKQLDPDLPEYKALEQPYPDMCADRIQYNLQTGLVFNLITPDEIEQILKTLHFNGEKWYFTDVSSALKFADLSVYFTEHFWSSELNEVVNSWGGELLARALEIKLITEDEIHYGTDTYILDQIKESNNQEIQILLQKLNHPVKHFYIGNEQYHTNHRCQKFRGIDPLILKSGKLERLTSLDSNFAKRYQKVKSKMQEGTYIINR